MKPEKLIELIVNSLPYPNQIKDLEIEEKMGGVRFTWRNARYRVSGSKDVEEVGNGVLKGSDNAILIKHLISKTEALMAV